MIRTWTFWFSALPFHSSPHRYWNVRIPFGESTGYLTTKGLPLGSGSVGYWAYNDLYLYCAFFNNDGKHATTQSIKNNKKMLCLKCRQAIRQSRYRGDNVKNHAQITDTVRHNVQQIYIITTWINSTYITTIIRAASTSIHTASTNYCLDRPQDYTRSADILTPTITLASSPCLIGCKLIRLQSADIISWFFLAEIST